MLTVNHAQVSYSIQNTQAAQEKISEPESTVTRIYQNHHQHSHPGVVVYDLGFKGIWKMMTQSEGESSSSWVGRFSDWLTGTKSKEQKLEQNLKVKSEQKKEENLSKPKALESSSLSWAMGGGFSGSEISIIDHHGKFSQLHQYFSEDYRSDVNYNILCFARFFSEKKLTHDQEAFVQMLSDKCLRNLCVSDKEMLKIMNTEGRKTNITTIVKKGYENFPLQISYIHTTGTFSDFVLDFFQHHNETSKIESCKNNEKNKDRKFYILMGGAIGLAGVAGLGVLGCKIYEYKRYKKSLYIPLT